MGLSQPKPRKHYHTRKIDVKGYYREDGLWDIEGHMIDTKPYPFANIDRGDIPSGEPIHEMWLRLTLDESLTVHDAEAATDYAPFTICPSITDRYKELVGMQIGPGWNRALKTKFGKTAGCTHLTELLGPIATVAFQTIFGSNKQMRIDNGLPPEQKDPSSRPGHLDGCHALDVKGPIVKRDYTPFYQGD